MGANTKKMLIGVVAAIVVLLGLLIVLLLTEPKDDSGNPSTTTTAEVMTSKLLYEKSPDTVVSLKVKNEKGTYEIERTQNGLSVKGLEGEELYTAYLTVLAERASSLVSQQVIEENASDLSKYGLKNPQTKIEVTFKNGDKKTLLLGNDIPLSEYEALYFCFEGEKTVHAVSKSPLTVFMGISKENLLSPIVTKVPQRDSEGKLPIVREMIIERSDFPYTITMAYDEEEAFVLTSPVDLKLTETIKYILPNGLYGISAISAVRYPVSESDLETAGLKEPFAVITMNSDAGKEKIFVGNKAVSANGTESYFVMVEGKEDIIYSVSSDVLPWIKIDVGDIAVSYVYKAVADTTTDITIKTRNVNETIKKSGKVSSEEFKATRNGEDMPVSDFRSLFEYLFKFRFERIVTDDTIIGGLTPYATITVKSEGNVTETLEFYDVGNKESVVTYNGKVSYYCRTSYIEVLEKNIKNLDNGEELVMTW